MRRPLPGRGAVTARAIHFFALDSAIIAMRGVTMVFAAAGDDLPCNVSTPNHASLVRGHFGRALVALLAGPRPGSLQRCRSMPAGWLDQVGRPGRRRPWVRFNSVRHAVSALNGTSPVKSS